MLCQPILHSMVKLLFCGDVGDWEVLAKRVNDLQMSNHGPFDALFIVGKCTVDNSGLSKLPLKTYVFDRSFADCSDSDVEYVGKDIGIFTAVHNLTVGYLLGSVNETSADYEFVKKTASVPSYRGCDILITSDWPRDAQHFLDSGEFNELQALNIGSGSKHASTFAMLLKPRYHFVGGRGCFYQRAPYRNSANSNGLPCAFSRLISIDKVSDSKDKAHKWMHALSFSPIIHMTAGELAEEPSGTTDCPYVTVGERSVPQGENPTKRARVEPANSAGGGGGNGAFFFGSAGGEAVNASLNLDAPNSTISTLFIGGLSREIMDFELKSSLLGATFVRRPPGKSFAFVEFGSHAAAKKVVETSSRHPLVIRGRTLTVGWGKEKESHGAQGAAGQDSESHAGVVHERQLVPPSSDSKTLFVGGLPSHIDSAPSSSSGGDGSLSELDRALLALFSESVKVFKIPGKSYAFVEFDSYDAAMAVVTKSINEVIRLQGRPLTVGWAKGDLISSSLNHQHTRAILTAAPSEDSNVLFLGNISAAAVDGDITSLIPNRSAVQSLRRPAGRDYAFLEFSTAAEAQEAINALFTNEPHVHGAKLLVGWAKGRAAERQDQSADCWFCLASPVVKVHLVVSVGEHSYLALPRGGLTDLHIMVSPIDCVPSRVHLSADAKKEVVRFLGALDQLHAAKGLCAVRFERALRTKGSRDHMQVHVVPLPPKILASNKAVAIFLQKASAMQLKFHEITNDRSIDEVVVTMEGGPYQEYFYIEIPTGGEDRRHKRFVYVHEDGSPRFPMQFGVELVAEIMGQPERGHWKNCLLTEAEEKTLAEQFRDQFTPYDFTQ